jgi:hypothetical protein
MSRELAIFSLAEEIHYKGSVKSLRLPASAGKYRIDMRLLHLSAFEKKYFGRSISTVFVIGA